MTTPETTWLTREEAAAYLRVTDRTIDRLADSGQITRYTIPGMSSRFFRFSRGELDALMTPKTGGEPLAETGAPQTD